MPNWDATLGVTPEALACLGLDGLGWRFSWLMLAKQWNVPGVINSANFLATYLIQPTR